MAVTKVCTATLNPLTTPTPILLIAGGRDYALSVIERTWLDGIQAHGQFRLVVHGGASGADAGGGAWAVSRGIDVKVFPADWSKGRRAGPDRNRLMASFLAANHPQRNVVVLFPGGRGTANMHACAEAHGLRTIIYTPFHETAR